MCGYCAGHGCSNQSSFDADDKGNVDEYAEEYREIDDVRRFSTITEEEIIEET